MSAKADANQWIKGTRLTSQLETLPYGADLWLRIEPVWNEMLRRTNDASSFLSPQWMRAWMTVFGPRLRPFGLVWRAPGGSPVACALLSKRPARLGPFPITRLFLNASGADGAGCEHNDVLVLSDFRDSVLDDLVRVVRESGSDELALVGVREGAAEAIRSRWPADYSEGYVSEAPYVALDRLRAEGTPYLSSLSPNTRSQLRRSIRLYEERFGRPSMAVAADRSEGTKWLSELVVLSGKRWRARGERGALEGETVRRFHEYLLEQCIAGDGPDQLSVDIIRIRFGQELLGFLFNLRYRGRVNYYQSGLRYQDDNRLKPGLVAHAFAVEHYLARGDHEYDFLGGEPEPVRYKRSLSTDVRGLAWMELQAATPKMRLLGVLRRLRRRTMTTWIHNS